MIELRIVVEPETTDALEAYFCEEYQENWMLREEWKTGENTLCGFFESREVGESALALLRKDFPRLSNEVQWLEVVDQDWQEAYKLHFKPWTDRGLHWVPIWEKESYVLPQGDQIVYLDPGMAFGTGNHETTRLCVRRLLDYRDGLDASAISDKSVIDAGCGSGILAISAAKLGFDLVYAFDNDPDAVSISRENELLCDLNGSIEFAWADLKEGLAGRKADLVMANILAPILIDHATIIAGAVADKGVLILSGILTHQAEGVKRAFLRHCPETTKVSSREDGEWADVVLEF
jgi:ribosomal protein L11 methyltransferase